ncbi:hypothetical protein ACHAQH_008928 [Verticillium albo-atrum]
MSLLLRQEGLHGLGTLALPPFQLQQHVGLIGAVGEPHRPGVRPHLCQGSVLTDAGTSIHLKSTVQNATKHFWNLDLGFRDLFEGELGVAFVDLDGGVEEYQSGGIGLHPVPGKLLKDEACS